MRAAAAVRTAAIIHREQPRLDARVPHAATLQAVAQVSRICQTHSGTGGGGTHTAQR